MAAIVLTEVLGQRYRIVICKQDKEAFAYEPLKSHLVRGRVGQMKRFIVIRITIAVDQDHFGWADCLCVSFFPSTTRSTPKAPYRSN